MSIGENKVALVDKENVLSCHRRAQGKMETIPKVLVDKEEDLSVYYTPGVSYVSEEIKADANKVYDYTMKSNTIAIVSDGTRILGLGNIGPFAGLPVMEGKALLFKKFGGVDAVPICISTKDEDEIVRLVKHISPTFGGINIEDIESPKSFRISKRLESELDIPVFHDDRQGTGVVAVAALINALKLARKGKDAKIIVNGAGSAGFGITMQLVNSGFTDITALDRDGAIYAERKGDMNDFKMEIAKHTNHKMLNGTLDELASGADVLIGASSPGAFKKEHINSMNEKPIVFALANPNPEISYSDAKNAGAFIVATGSSDNPNQVNNLLAFPGIMRGLLDSRAKRVTYKMLHAAALVISKSVGRKLSTEYIIPRATDKKYTTKTIPMIAASVAESVVAEGHARNNITYSEARDKASRLIKRYMRIEKRISRFMVASRSP